jgi:hypothetical protein
VHLQPPDVLVKRPELARAFRHELVHVALSDAVGGGLPRWFNEGMAMVVAGQTYPETLQFSSAKALEDTLGGSTSHGALRSAYATAGRLVRSLLQQHGRDKLLALIAGIGENSGFEARFRKLTGHAVDAWVTRRLVE